MDLAQILFPHLFINDVSDDLVDDDDELTDVIKDECEVFTDKTGAMPKH